MARLPKTLRIFVTRWGQPAPVPAKRKLHARGPMALEELMTYKYVIRGYGQIRE
jgi:gamma-glutamyl phosphate reductase